MTLRPRYSLLTLLVLTALVAGGVKLWYGPHTKILKTTAGEVEYTFTRDLNGRQLRQGPLIMRFISSAGDTYHALIRYYRDDDPLQVMYSLRKFDHAPSDKGLLDFRELSPATMTSEELKVFRSSIESERMKYKISSPEFWWHETLLPRVKAPQN